MIQPALRRPPAGPSAFRVLLPEQASPPALTRHSLPRTLDGTLRGADDIAERLPANSGVAVEKPSIHGVIAARHCSRESLRYLGGVHDLARTCRTIASNVNKGSLR